MTTYTIIKKDGRRYNVTTNPNRRTTIRSGSGFGSGGEPTVYNRRTGRKSTTATINKIQEATQQDKEVKVNLRANKEVETPEVLQSTSTSTKTNNDFQVLRQEQFLQDLRNIEQYKKDREVIVPTPITNDNTEFSRFDKSLQKSIEDTKSHSFLTRIKGGIGEVSVRSDLLLGHTTKAMVWGVKDLFSGKEFYTFTPRSDGTFLRSKSTFSEATKQEYSKGAKAVYGLSFDDIVRNPLNVVPAIADTMFKIGVTGTLQNNMDASRLQVSTTKQGGFISTEAKGDTITFKSGEVGNIKVKLEQSPIGFRVPEKLGGLGNKPLTTQDYYYSTLSRGQASLTNKYLFNKQIAKTTSETFLTVKDTTGKTLIDNSLVSQSLGKSTSGMFYQSTTNFNPVNYKNLGTVREIGGKASFEQGGLYSVKQGGISEFRSLGVSNIKEEIASVSQGVRTSAGVTNSKGLDVKFFGELNNKGSQVLTFKPLNIDTSQTIKPVYLSQQPSYTASSLFNAKTSPNIYGIGLIGNRKDNNDVGATISTTEEKTGTLIMTGKKLVIKPIQENILSPIVTPIIIPDVKKKNKSKSDTSVKQIIEEITTPVTITQPTTITIPKVTTVTKQVFSTIKNTPSRFIPPFVMALPSRNKVITPKAGYNVLVRSKGIFRKANIKPLTKTDALNFGSFRVGTSASATFKLEKATGRLGKYSGGKGKLSDFYTKNGLFIEKRGRRIKSSGELQEITYKGIATVKAKGKKKKLKKNPFLNNNNIKSLWGIK